MKKRTMWIIGLSILAIVLSGPLLTNILMSIKAPEFLVPKEGISTDGVWVGFMATFYGAIIGGTISGLITYLGVLKTINSQDEQRKKDDRVNKRCFLQFKEISRANLDLKNVNVTNSRLIIRDKYADFFSNKEYRNQAKFNFIELSNSNNNVALNCNMQVEIIDEEENKEEKNFVIPVIDGNEKIYIHIDPDPMYPFRISAITLTFETTGGEKMKIERNLTKRDQNYFSTDMYYAYSEEEKKYEPLFNINGSHDEWIIINNK